jgi:KaiC/GvpD/RAD55 family RecA-like ATPase
MRNKSAGEPTAGTSFRLPQFFPIPHSAFRIHNTVDQPTKPTRLSTGVPGLDELLGGGLLPGTLTVVMGATGIGKTQLGLQFAQAGQAQEGQRGVIFDMTCRGDSQSHADYAQRMFGWQLTQSSRRTPCAARSGSTAPPVEPTDGSRSLPATFGEPADFFDLQRQPGDYLHVFDYQGRRVTRRDLEEEMWRQWKSELITRLDATIGFFYGNFVRGVRRAVVDGVEPTDRPGDSIQFELFEYIYHQILRKESDWVARDLFRQHYRANAAAVAEHAYDHRQLACLLLYTSHESMLDGLISRPLDEGDLLSNANTVIYLGKTREGNKLGRALYIAKHRGSACSDEIVPYQIGTKGLSLPA